jgi:hypothetical protein
MVENNALWLFVKLPPAMSYGTLSKCLFYAERQSVSLGCHHSEPNIRAVLGIGGPYLIVLQVKWVVTRHTLLWIVELMLSL